MDTAQFLSDDYEDDFKRPSDDYAYEEDDAHPSVGDQIEVDGKRGSVKSLFSLQPEKLPCPAPSTDDLMASEQPSGRRDHGSSSSIFSFASGARASQADALAVVLVAALAARCFFT